MIDFVNRLGIQIYGSKNKSIWEGSSPAREMGVGVNKYLTRRSIGTRNSVTLNSTLAKRQESHRDSGP